MAVGWHITNRADIFGRPGEHCRSGWGHPTNRPGGPPAAGQDSPRAGFAKGRFPAKAGLRPRGGGFRQGGASAKGGGFCQGGASAKGRGLSPRLGFGQGRGLLPRRGFGQGGASAKVGLPAKGGGFRQGGAAQGRGIHGSRRRGYGMAVPGPARGGRLSGPGECAAGSHNKIQMEEIRK